ncbi:flippase activity-associated protein Agl23 [Haloarcula onubensis]|uniref:TIGR03663 family protein n=1 Tax=Haloarcula onubensis TaxID=2950539 RepID=A0ABU2FRE9_9EURY|nr:flippase activity-associated protein Agl23 [Halomicroarcula sp. S3CR25-11]MDS0282994.1 TIGR03663 family protein [Halomicroarcula sp. S3CR25-11]
MERSSSPLQSLQQVRRRGASWLDTDDHATVKLVVAITLVALAARVVFLGSRVAHFDEGRVAYWAWHFGETGNFAYRYIIHGPFIQHVDRWLFALVGPGDFAMRLPVAVVGGLLPLTALLLREHLDRSETVALALLFTLDPVLVYYSRFMRSDVLVAAFMFTAFALLVRLYDTRRARYMYAAAVFLALGFASKENALVYVVTWLGATGLLLAKILLLPNGFRDAIGFLLPRQANDVATAVVPERFGPVRFARGPPSVGAVRDRVVGRVKGDVGRVVGIVQGFRRRHDAAWQVAGAYVGHLVLAVLLFGLVSLFFYAPRGAGIDGIESHPAIAATTPGYVGFWEGVTNPSLFGPMLDATIDRVVDQWGNWVEPGTEKAQDTYAKHFWTSTGALMLGSRVVAVLAGVGYLLDRLGVTTPRHLIPFCFYAGFVSIFGYPLGTDIGAPWLAVHMVVPLAVPAAVALGGVFRWGSQSLSTGDAPSFASAALVLFALSVLVAQAGVAQVYTNTTEDSNPLVQYAQPNAELKGELLEMERLAAANDGSTDVVVYYGESGEQFDRYNAYVSPDRDKWDESARNNKPTCLMWYNSLPLPWYFAAGEMDVDCENEERNLASLARQQPPPVIITQNFDPTVPEDRLRAAGYEGDTYRMRTTGDRNLFTVWTNEAVVDNSTAG